MKKCILAIKSCSLVCLFTISLLIILGCYKSTTNCGITPANISNLLKYKENRINLIEKIRPETEKLNFQEKMASEQFEALKQNIYNKNQPATPWISKPFYEVKDEIANTRLYKIIQQMPKGGILHLHPAAMGNLQVAIDKAMTRKDTYVLTKGNNRGMIRFTDGKDLVAISSINNFGLNKEDLLKCVTIGAEHLFGFFSQCYEQTSLIVTTNLPFAEWPQVFGDDERLAGALLDRLTHHVHVVEIIAKSFRLNSSLKSKKRSEQ